MTDTVAICPACGADIDAVGIGAVDSKAKRYRIRLMHRGECATQPKPREHGDD